MPVGRYHGNTDSSNLRYALRVLRKSPTSPSLRSDAGARHRCEYRNFQCRERLLLRPLRTAAGSIWCWPVRLRRSRQLGPPFSAFFKVVEEHNAPTPGRACITIHSTDRTRRAEQLSASRVTWKFSTCSASSHCRPRFFSRKDQPAATGRVAELQAGHAALREPDESRRDTSCSTTGLHGDRVLSPASLRLFGGKRRLGPESST